MPARSPTRGYMEFQKCKACGSNALVPLELSAGVSQEGDFLADADDAQFYSCQVCGDNWLSVRRTPENGPSEVLFVYQMNMKPLLRRTASLSGSVVRSRRGPEQWSYFFGDDEVEEGRWRERLDERRRVLRSMCVN